MAQWHFIKNGVGFSWKEDGAPVSNWDDGLAFNPDEEGFSREAADAKAASLGKGVTAEYSGTPNWHARIEAEQAAQYAAETEVKRLSDEQAADAVLAAAEEMEAEQRRNAAHAELDALLNPDAVAAAAVNARFDAMLAAAPEREADIQNLREAALQQLEG